MYFLLESMHLYYKVQDTMERETHSKEGLHKFMEVEVVRGYLTLLTLL